MRSSVTLIAAVLVGCGGGSFEVAEGSDAAIADTTSVTSDTAADTLVINEVAVDTATPDTADAAKPDAPADALPCSSPIQCWADLDGDGYAAAGAVMTLACACPKNTTSRSPSSTIDCNDEDPRVHPGDVAYQVDPYCVPGTSCSDKSFDYDCSGTEERQDTVVFTSCSSFLSGCSGAGWVGSVAGCGVSADFSSCSTGVATCNTSTASKKQKCR